MNGPAARSGVEARFRLEAPATRGSIRLFSDAIQLYLREALALGDREAEATRTRLAIMEAVTNVVRHAYPADAPGPLRIDLSREGEELVTVITDRARPFDPFATTDPEGIRLPDPEDLATGGYGLGIIRSVMKTIRHRAVDGGNELTLRCRLPSG